MCLILRWCRGWELNPRPWDYETHALTTELPRQPNFDGTGRWEQESIRLGDKKKLILFFLPGKPACSKTIGRQGTSNKEEAPSR